MSSLSTTPVKSFSSNQEGRDFIIGDLHGELLVLEAALDFLDFDKRVDRVFSVGDLIDRGPYSEEILRQVPDQWLYPVLGNHEYMLLEFMDMDSDMEQAWYAHGGEWWMHLPNRDKRQLKNIVKRYFTYAIELQTPFGVVGLVHGDMPQGVSWDQLKQDLNGKQLHLNHILWSRTTVAEQQQHIVAGLKLLFVGHTRIEDATIFGNVVAMDTGSGYKTSERIPCPALSIAQIEEDGVSVFKFARSLVLSKQKFSVA